MTAKTLNLTDELRNYLLSINPSEHPVLARLRRKTEGHPLQSMQIGPEQGQLMALLVRLMGARLAIEVGVFTGYSSIAVALALPQEGRIVACDNNEKFISEAQRYWADAGVEYKIEPRLGRALSTLKKMIADGEAGKYDFAFIDADKESYQAYYELLIQLIRPGGLIAVDNVLWSGRVIDPEVDDPDTIAIRAFNEKISHDPRVVLSVIPIGDGLTLAMKI